MKHLVVPSMALLIGLSSLLAETKLTIHPLISDGAILQRGVAVPVWGSAAPGIEVTVGFGGQKVTGETDQDGRWAVRLASLEASAQPRDLTVTAPNTAPLKIRNVLVGDVWLASGQSNMASPMSSGSAAKALPEIAEDRIRFFTVPKAVSAETRSAPAGGEWVAADPQAARNFSAVAYFFAREILASQDVPVGVIHASWGGTPIRVWMPLGAIEAPPPLSDLSEEWQRALERHQAAQADPEALAAYYAARKEWETTVDAPYRAARKAWTAAADDARAAGQPTPPAPQPASPKPESPDPLAMPAPATSDRPAAPTGCFNAMIAPLAPYALRGVLWYQGEADSGRGTEYRELLPRLIRGWRAAWDLGELPFLIVQLPGFGRNEGVVAEKGIPWLREAQDAARSLAATEVAVTSDIGDPADVHPDNKEETGRRLALVARESVYGESIDGISPRFAAVTFAGGRATISFDQVGGGLTIGEAPWVPQGTAAISTDRLRGFAVAGADRQWVEAEAVIQGDAVVVWSDDVQDPLAVRYAWANSPQANLATTGGLPVAPFRTDDWAK